MKIKEFVSYWSCIVLIVLFVEGGVAAEDLQPYDPPAAGFDRMVFRLPPLEQEADHMVEILVGKVLAVDCNRHAFLGNLDRGTVVGWGYPYFTLAKVDGPVTTLMACPEGQEKEDRFITVNGQGFKQRYNSKLPVVVYVPEGFEVRFRIWTAGTEIGQASKE